MGRRGNLLVSSGVFVFVFAARKTLSHFCCVCCVWSPDTKPDTACSVRIASRAASLACWASSALAWRSRGFSAPAACLVDGRYGSLQRSRRPADPLGGSERSSRCCVHARRGCSSSRRHAVRGRIRATSPDAEPSRVDGGREWANGPCPLPGVVAARVGRNVGRPAGAGLPWRQDEVVGVSPVFAVPYLFRRADLDVSILQIADPLWPCSGAATGVRTPHHPVGGFKEAGWARVAGWRGVPS